MGGSEDRVKYCYIDCETTGLDSKHHGIIQLAAIMEINGEEVSRYSEKIRPASSCAADASALKVSGNTIEMIRGYAPEPVAHDAFSDWLSRDIGKFDKSDKAFFCGYNSSFDNQFVREFFSRNNDPYFGSWFWSGTIDVMALALHHLAASRPEMENFKLGTVATKILGPDRVAEITNKVGLHDAMTDIVLTREIFREITKA